MPSPFCQEPAADLHAADGSWGEAALIGWSKGSFSSRRQAAYM